MVTKKPIVVFCRSCLIEFKRTNYELLCPKCWDKTHIKKGDKNFSRKMKEVNLESRNTLRLLQDYGLHHKSINSLFK